MLINTGKIPKNKSLKSKFVVSFHHKNKGKLEQHMKHQYLFEFNINYS